MKFSELKNSLSEGNIYPAYLFFGEDAFFCERGLSFLKEKFVTEPSLNYTELNSENLDVAELISSLYAYPFMSEKRVIAVKDFYPNSSETKALKDYFNNPAEYSVLAVVNKKPCEAIENMQGVCFVDCGKEDTGLLTRWIKAECEKFSVSIDLESAKMLSEYCLSDMSRISNETDKLCAYVGENGTITKKDIEETVSCDNDYKMYELTEFIGKKKFDKALSVIKNMLFGGETEQHILSSVYNYFRRLLFASISDKSDLELSRDLGVKEFAAKKIKEQSKMFKRKSLKATVDRLADSDYRIKGGFISSDEEMWLTLFEIMID